MSFWSMVMAFAPLGFIQDSYRIANNGPGFHGLKRALLWPRLFVHIRPGLGCTRGRCYGAGCCFLVLH